MKWGKTVIVPVTTSEGPSSHSGAVVAVTV